MSNNAVDFRVQGFKELKDALKNLPDKVKKSKLVSVQKKAVKPLIMSAKRNTPIREGDLSDSIKAFTGRSKDFAIVHVGHQEGSGKSPDGFYGYWVHEGSGGRQEGKQRKPASKHFDKAVAEKGDGVVNNIIDEAWNLIKKEF